MLRGRQRRPQPGRAAAGKAFEGTVPPGHAIRILTGAGFVVEALHELYAPPDAPEGNHGLASGEWAAHWPIEEVWVARLPQ